MTETQPFSQPTRQSSAAIIFILGGVLKMLVRQLWVVILVFFFNRKSSFDNYTLIFLGLAAFTALMSLLNYFNLYFYIKDGELVLEKGVLRKSKINVPLDRIQTVNFRQSLLHQFFNVVAVDIDTAGSAGKEFSLHALSKQDAELLREVVGGSAVRQVAGGSQQSAVGSDQTGGNTEHLPIGSDESAIRNPQSAIFRLIPLDLLKIGVSQNHLRTAGILLAFFIGFADDVEQALGMDFEKKMAWWLGTTDGSDLLSWLLLLAPIMLLASFLVTLVRTVLQYFDLRFWRTERGFKIVSGLFTRQEVSAVLTKIQFVKWTSSPLMRLFKMVRVQMPQAASVEVRGKLMVGLPGCYGPQVSAVRAAYFPEEKDLDWEAQGIAPFNAWLRFLKLGPLPVLVLMEITRSWMGTWTLLWLGWLAVAWWLARRYQRNWRWHVSEQGLRAEWGVLQRNAVLLQWHKVQAVSARRGFFSKETGLAQLAFYTAAGAVRIPYIPVAMAAAVQDFVLFKIETDSREWM